MTSRESDPVITQEMIDAGLDILAEFDWYRTGKEETVRAIMMIALSKSAQDAPEQPIAYG